MSSILCSNARTLVAQLLTASEQNSEDPGLNPGWIAMSFFIATIRYIVASITVIEAHFPRKTLATHRFPHPSLTCLTAYSVKE